MTATGPNIAGTGANDSSVGGVWATWANPSNVTANDGTVAQASTGSMAGAGGPASQYLKATNFGFAIASDQVIDGITVLWRVRNNVNTMVDNAVRIVKGGVIGSTDKSSGTAWSGSLTDRTYGGVSDLWGETWTYSDINDSGFGAALSCVNSAGDSQGDIDYVSITVEHHTVSGPDHKTMPVLTAQTSVRFMPFNQPFNHPWRP